MTTAANTTAVSTTDAGADLAAHIIAGQPYVMPAGLTQHERNLVYAYAVGWVTEVNRHDNIRRAAR